MDRSKVEFMLRPFARRCRVCHTMKDISQFRLQANAPMQNPRCKVCDSNAQRARRSYETFVSNRS